MPKKDRSGVQKASPSSGGQELPKKWQDVFDHRVLGAYEKEQFKNAIREADKILEKFPQHGETIALKGLCYHTEGDKVKGNQLISQGLQNNLKSSLCWRVKGVAHKAENELLLAIKCYRQALSYSDDRNSKIRINSEMASLHLQLQQFEEFEKIRRELWINNSNDKSNVVAYAVSTYLSGNYATGVEFIENHLLKLDNLETIEINEIYLLTAKMLYKSGQLQQCLKFIDEHLSNGKIKDRVTALTLKKDICYSLKKTDQCCDIVKQLIDINSENIAYHREYLQLIGFILPDGSYDASKADSAQQWYTQLSAKFPKCSAIDRMELECVSDDEFRSRADCYMRNKISHSVKSLYADLKSLYNGRKGEIIDSLLGNYLKELASSNRFSEKDDQQSASPSCYLWATFYAICRQLDLREWEKAMAMCDETIAIFPTCIDLYVLKARIYKFGGNASEAFKQLNFARELDLADRFLNTKCSRYALRVGEMEKAEEIVRLFLKKSEGTKVLQSLEVMWYELHKAEAHQSRKEYGCALRQYHHVLDHFQRFWENQTDFHKYSYRKVAISAYLALLRWETHLRSHPFFNRAAIGAVDCWIQIHNLSSQNRVKELEFGSEPEKEGKIKRSPDWSGWELIHDDNPLKRALEWVDQLLKSSRDDDLLGHTLAIRVYRLQSNWDAALRSVRTVLNTPQLTNQSQTDTAFIKEAFTLFHCLEKENIAPETKSPSDNTDAINISQQSLKEEFLKKSKSLRDFALNYLSESTTLDQLLCVIECLAAIGECSTEVTAPIVDQIKRIQNPPIKDCTRAVAVLESILKQNKKQRFPFSVLKQT